MKNPTIISVNLLVVFLLYMGCKEEEQLALFHYKPDSSTEAPEDKFPEGKWNIDSLTISSASLPSGCKQIESGTIFEFTKEDSLKVFPKEALNPCNTYHYKIQNDFIQLVKDDMVMLVEYKLISKNRLVLKSKSFFRWQEEDVADLSTHQQLLKEGVTAFLTKM